MIKMSSKLNPFQQSAQIYLGITGGGPLVIPTPPTLTVAGTKTVSGVTGLFEFSVPATAKNIVVMGRGVSITGGPIGVYLEDTVATSFGVDITPSALTGQQVLLESYSYNSKVWVGSMNAGGINGTTESKTEMMGGTLLTDLTKVVVQTVSGDFTAGTWSVLYV